MTRPKPLLLLAYVCLNGATTRRELAETFFPDADDARDTLSTTLRHLRKVAAVEILADERIAARVDSDAAALLRDFDAYRYEAVLNAYTGPFLDGLDVDLGLELETWLFTTREAIARRVRSAALHRARAALALDRHDDARRLALEAVTLRGAPELEMDELANALPVLERLELPEAAALRELAESYGLDLDRPRGSGGARELLRPPIAERFHRNTAFIGRRDELRALDDLLRDPDERLLTLFGMGGVGKTRLAYRLAERWAAQEPERFPDGVAVVSLEAVRNADEVVPAIAARLALPPVAGSSTTELAAALASWQALLVLDNVEHVADVAEDLAALLAAAPRLRLLVTSRVRLGLAEERSVEVRGLSTERDDGAPSDAASLFLERAERVGFPSEAARRDLEAIEVVCATLEGYPLGIELAASLTRALGVAEIREALADALSLLDHGPLDAPERHRGVRSVLEPSWALLNDGDRDALRRLSVFRTGFQFDAAAAVGGVSLPTLLRLVDHAIVRSEGSGRGRFGFHPVTLAYLRERTGDEAREAAEEAHRRFYAHLLATSAARVASEPHEVLDRLEADLPDVVHAAASSLQAGESDTGVALVRALVVEIDYLQARGGGDDLIEMARQTAVLAESLGDLDSAEKLRTKVANAIRTIHGDVDRAVGEYRHALELAERGGDVARQVMLRAILGALLHERSPAEADDHLEVAHALARTSNDDAVVCELLQRWAFVATARGEWPHARALGSEAVEIAERLLLGAPTDRTRVTSLLFFSLHNLGKAAEELGDVEASFSYRHRALALAIERDQERWAAYAHADLASACADLGRFDEARRHGAEAIRLYERHGALRERDALRRTLEGWTGATDAPPVGSP